MKNFCRILRIALGYRWTVVTTLLLSLGVGLLWGLNIGTIYPFVEVVFNRQSLQQWVDEEISKAESTAEELQQKIADLRQQQELGPADV
ncbi:MAG: ABC transporter ATP-binding protein, partial [Planctomycetota bacterium]|nr:ABC transporter ATP-binding protein [Planctomycetota bacterium]